MLFRRSYLKRMQPLNALILPGVLLFAVARCLSASASSDTANNDAVKQGGEIFHQRCIVCHNKQPGDNTPFGPPNLYKVFGSHPALLTSQQAETIVVHGRAQMPAFGAILTRTEIRSVLAYLRKRAATGANTKQPASAH
jgi:mono/diheme cytochrome c family protein